MKEWHFEEYLNAQIEEIKQLKANGYTDRDILDKKKFCCDALDACSIPITYLLPRIEGQVMNAIEWNTHTSADHKFEYIDVPFNEVRERDRVMLGLIYTAGLKHLLEILPPQSRRELVELVNQLPDTIK